MNQNSDRVFHSFATALTFWERSRGMHRPTGHSPCSLQNRPVGAGLDMTNFFLLSIIHNGLEQP